MSFSFAPLLFQLASPRSPAPPGHAVFLARFPADPGSTSGWVLEGSSVAPEPGTLCSPQ